MVDKESMRECYSMEILREELSKRGIEWRDDSDLLTGISYRVLMLRTKWEKDGHEVSVVWGYSVIDMVPKGLTYGWPEYLECWFEPNCNDPVSMSLAKILEVCA